MFSQTLLTQDSKPVLEDEDVLKRKLNLKVMRHYSDIGKIPGVLLEDNKRRKLLKELGVELQPQPTQ
jgi:hypothetical protein